MKCWVKALPVEGSWTSKVTECTQVCMDKSPYVAIHGYCQISFYMYISIRQVAVIQIRVHPGQTVALKVRDVVHLILYHNMANGFKVDLSPSPIMQLRYNGDFTG